MGKNSLLLSKDKRVAGEIDVGGGGAPKVSPRTFEEARDRLSPMVAEASRQIDGLPLEACPDDEAVISLTLDPDDAAKSGFPEALMQDEGIEVVGSRPKASKPGRGSGGRASREDITTELFAIGHRDDIRNWSQQLPDWRSDRHSARSLLSVEEVSAPLPQSKIKGSFADEGRVTVETVLHSAARGPSILQSFVAFLDSQDVGAEIGRHFLVGGLCFLELDVPADRVTDIALFSRLRVLRRMPVLRIPGPTVGSARVPATDRNCPRSDHDQKMSGSHSSMMACVRTAH